MPLKNSLNVSELLKRLGVKGDSQGSASLLESLRLSLSIGDLSDLVPPIGVPFGGAAISSQSGVGTFNHWSLHCRSPGGLTVRMASVTGSIDQDVWITPINPFGAIVVSSAHNYSFGQKVRSLVSSHTPTAKVAPANVFQMPAFVQGLGQVFDSWVGPGEFFNVEDNVQSHLAKLRIEWKEYPAALNP